MYLLLELGCGSVTCQRVLIPAAALHLWLLSAAVSSAWGCRTVQHVPMRLHNCPDMFGAYPDALGDVGLVCCCHEVSLVQQDLVGERHLLNCRIQHSATQHTCEGVRIECKPLWRYVCGVVLVLSDNPGACMLPHTARLPRIQRSVCTPRPLTCLVDHICWFDLIQVLYEVLAVNNCQHSI